MPTLQTHRCQLYECDLNIDYLSISTALRDGAPLYSLQIFGPLASKRQKSILIPINIMTTNEHLGLGFTMPVNQNA